MESLWNVVYFFWILMETYRIPFGITVEIHCLLWLLQETYEIQCGIVVEIHGVLWIRKETQRI